MCVKRVDHVAIVVRDIESALKFWNEALGIPLTRIKDVPAENSTVAFLQLAGSEIELVQPTTSDSGIAKFLEKRGEGMHHVCLEVQDIDEMLTNLLAKGIRLINEQPRNTDDGKRYAFIHPESTGGVLVELYEIIER